MAREVVRILLQNIDVGLVGANSLSAGVFLFRHLSFAPKPERQLRGAKLSRVEKFKN